MGAELSQSVRLSNPSNVELQRVEQIKRWSEEAMFFAASRNLLEVLKTFEKRTIETKEATAATMAQFYRDHRDSMGATILHVAILCDAVDVVRYLTSSYPTPELIDAQYTKGRYLGETALHMAIVKRSFEFVRLLVQAGAETNLFVEGTFFNPNSRDYCGVYFGSTPLHFAVATNQLPIVEYLLMHGGAISSKDVYKENTAMHVAVLHNLTEMYDLLMAYDESGIDRQANREGLTPLQLAASLAKKEMCSHILNTTKEVGWTFGDISQHLYPIEQIDTFRVNKLQPVGMLQLIVMGGTDEHARLLNIPVLNDLLEEKWAKFAQPVFYLQVLVYLMVTLMATYSSVADKVVLTGYNQSLDVMALDIIVFIVVMLESLFEGHDLVGALFRPKSHYVRFLYNNITQTCVSWGMRISVLLTFILEVANAEDRQRRGARAMAIVFLYYYLLNLLRNFRITGNFVMLLEQMIIRTIQWVIVFVFLLVAFSLGFYIIFRDTLDSTFGGVGVLMIVLIQWTVGQVDFANDYKLSANQSVGVILFVIFSFLVSTIMFNLLIALMSAVYTKLSAQAELFSRLSWATNVLTIEHRLTHLPFLHKYLRCGKRGIECGFIGNQDLYYKVVIVPKSVEDPKSLQKSFRIKYLPGPLQSETEYSDKLKRIISICNIPQQVLKRPYAALHAIVSRYDPKGTQVLSREAFKFLMLDLFAAAGISSALSDNELRDLAVALDGGDQDNRIAIESVYLFFRAMRRQWLPPARRKALVIVDMQNDFVLPTGSLSVGNAPSIIVAINRLRNLNFDMVVLTQDWHPANHCSFGKPGDTGYMCDDSNVVQVKWPPHCIQDSEGAQIVDGLQIRQTDVIVKKGSSVEVDAYSAFWDCLHLHETELFGHLFDNDIDTVVICGVAYDVCVAETARDASIYGFETYVAMDAVMAIDEGRRREAGLMLHHFNVFPTRSTEISKTLATPGRMAGDFFRPNLKKLQRFQKNIVTSRSRPRRYVAAPEDGNHDPPLESVVETPI